MNKKSKNLFKNTFLFFIGSIGSKLIQFILVPLYTYTLTTEQYGKVDLLLTLVNFLMPIFSIQLTDALLRFGLDKNISKDKLLNVVFKCLFIGSAISLIFSPILTLSKDLKDIVPFFFLILNLRIYRDILAIVLKIEEKNNKFALDSIFYTIILSISSIIFLVVLKMNVTGYLLSYVIANVFSIIYILLNSDVSIRRNIKEKVDQKLLREVIVYSIPMVINSISFWITNASDRIMLNYMTNISVVGLYAVASKIPTIISTFTGIFNQAWLISSINEYEGDRDERFYSQTFKYYCGISILLCSIMILFLRYFMKIYVSPEYYVAWKYSSILIVSAVFSGVSAFLNSIFYAYKEIGKSTISTFVGAILNIFLNIILIPKYSIYGAAIATLISWMYITIERLFLLNKFLKLKIEYKVLFFSIVLLIADLIIINLINNNIISYTIMTINLFIILLLQKEILKEVKKISVKFLRKKRGKNNDLSEE